METSNKIPDQIKSTIQGVGGIAGLPFKGKSLLNQVTGTIAKMEAIREADRLRFEKCFLQLMKQCNFRGVLERCSTRGLPKQCICGEEIFNLFYVALNPYIQVELSHNLPLMNVVFYWSNVEMATSDRARELISDNNKTITSKV